MPNVTEASVAQPPVAREPVRVEIAAASADATRDLARTTLAVFFMVGLAAASLWILRPFIPAITWAAMVVVATWPFMLRVQSRLWGKRWIAVALMSTALLLAFAIPFSLAVTMVVSHSDDIGRWAVSLRHLSLPSAPAWIEPLPVVGLKLTAAWNEWASAGPEGLVARLEPYIRGIAAWLVAQLGGAGMIIVQFLLTVVIAAILYGKGEKAAAGVLGFFHKLAGVHGQNVVVLVERAIRAVALGVIVTALVQSTLGGIGLAIAGVPFAGLLTACMFVLSVAQIGPAPVLIGAVIWMYATSDSSVTPTVLLVWSIFVGAIDNFLRPLLIQRSGNLPLIMVFAGVVGGLLSFGLIGIFLGPVVLAVVYMLLEAWVGTNFEADKTQTASLNALSRPVEP
jgi:predicted PurR-regulated permease PerM